MTTLFSDNFESGDFSAWTGTNNDGGTGGVLEVQGSIVHGGVKAAHMIHSTAGTSTGQGAFCYKDYTGSATGITTLTAWVRMASTSGAGVMRVLQLSQGVTAVARIEYTNGGYQLRLRRRDGTDATTALSSGFTLNTWQQCDLVYDDSGAQPVATVYISGSSVATLTDATAGSAVVPSRCFCLSFLDTATATTEVYFDDVVVADTAPAGGGSTFNDAGQATAPWVGSAADAWTMADAGQALSAWTSGALDTMTMSDAGGGVLVAVASGSDGSAPAVQLPYQGDTTTYDSAGATGSVSGGTILATGTIYDSAGATGSTSGATVLPAETNYD